MGQTCFDEGTLGTAPAKMAKPPATSSADAPEAGSNACIATAIERDVSANARSRRRASWLAGEKAIV